MTAAVSSGAEAVRLPGASGSSSLSSNKKQRSAISLTAPTPNNIGQVRKLNSVLFPVRYSERWYKDLLKPDNLAISRLGLYNDIPVAVLAARYEQASAEAPTVGGVNVYLMTLGVLAPYRRRGLASELLRYLLSVVKPGQTSPAVEEDIVVPIKLSEHNPSPASTLPAPAAPESVETEASKGKANGTSSKAAASTPAKAGVKRYHFPVQSVYLHVQTSNTEARALYESHGFKVTREISDYYRKGVDPQSAWLLELRA
ncbi:N-acetyltransferase 5 [Tilletia horrida]|nr:N-acetyltransferase 5 [Tilletia horrida]